MKTLIEVRDLTFTYLGSMKASLKKVNLNVFEGEFVILTGPSGCGKTTLCRVLTGLIPHFYPGKLTGRVTVLGKNIEKTPIEEIVKHVGLVFQNPDTQIIMTTVEREIAFGLENMALPPDKIREKVREVSFKLGIMDLLRQNVSRLSGGQKQKIAIASVLAMEPKILILDEPSSFLSPASASRLFHFLRSLNSEQGITIILVEHRLDLAARYASKLVVMDDGEVIAEGDPREVFSIDLTKISSANVPSLIKLYHRLKGFGVSLRRIPLTAEEAAATIKGVLNLD